MTHFSLEKVCNHVQSTLEKTGAIDTTLQKIKDTVSALIGAVTTAAAKGTKASKIKTLERWESTAYQ